MIIPIIDIEFLENSGERISYLDKAPRKFLRSPIRGNSRQLGIKVKSALELEVVPVILHILARRPHLPVLDDDVIEEDNLRHFHRDIVLIGSGLEVGYYTGPDTERRTGQLLLEVPLLRIE